MEIFKPVKGIRMQHHCWITKSHIYYHYGSEKLPTKLSLSNKKSSVLYCHFLFSVFHISSSSSFFVVKLQIHGKLKMWMIVIGSYMCIQMHCICRHLMYLSSLIIKFKKLFTCQGLYNKLFNTYQSTIYPFPPLKKLFAFFFIA